ncbi:MAG: penicillin-binding protein 1C [Cyclobacteriaceae bacterium]|nr:penicillin-binding protein 1C [Cyclobacteriaceae bacterium]
MRRKLVYTTVVLCGLLAGYWLLALPSVLFQDSYSTLLLDRDGNLLSASIAMDGQWRFPEVSNVPDRYKQAVVLFEDKRFDSHPGVDLLALGRAFKENITEGRVKSGASTLSMQVIRLHRRNPPRTLWQKAVEIFLATRLEWRYSKDEILALYASHAPFGGNVVGLDAACWRYFNHAAVNITWAEAALLAVLPNNPSLMHPGRSRERLTVRRNQLLQRLHAAGHLDAQTLTLAVAEPIPMEPSPVPQWAHHLLAYAGRQGLAQQRLTTTLDINLQELVEQKLEGYRKQLEANQIHNAAVVIASVQGGEVLAYAGNVRAGRAHQEDVDVIQAPRSTGSILKPFLFAALAEEGKLIPQTLMPDVPTYIAGFAPKNFSRQFDGAVPAGEALIRSLNVPAVHELRQYRYEKFHALLQRLGMTTLHRPPDHYGLSLVLGGAEGTLWDITGMYASMARMLESYRAGMYDAAAVHPLRFLKEDQIKDRQDGEPLFSAATLWQTMEVLRELNRPGEATGWRHFSSSRTVAWKTGTSFGFRDGWAVGVTPDYVVGVWTGNADGEGRPGLTGTETAAPLMLDLFSALPAGRWFTKPVGDLVEITVCAASGFRATELCSQTRVVEVGVAARTLPSCTYHHRVHLSMDRKHRVHRSCEANPIEQIWFTLPPLMEYYYRQQHTDYQSLPPYRRDCEDPLALPMLELIYPKPMSVVVIPRNLDGSQSAILAEAAHRTAGSVIYWHMDGQYLGETRRRHQLVLSPAPGEHRLTILDDQGHTLSRTFRVEAAR